MCQTIERDSRGRPISHGQLYQLPAPRGLLAGSWVQVDGPSDPYGQIISCLDPEYDFRGRLLTDPHTTVCHNGGRVNIERCALYLIRGRAQTEPPHGITVWPTANI